MDLAHELSDALGVTLDEAQREMDDYPGRLRPPTPEQQQRDRELSEAQRSKDTRIARERAIHDQGAIPA